MLVDFGIFFVKESGCVGWLGSHVHWLPFMLHILLSTSHILHSILLSFDSFSILNIRKQC